MNKPRILLFTGEGKGKTTAAMGMVLRAVGHRIKPIIIQFVKQNKATGELKSLARLGVEIKQGGKGFVPEKGTEQYEEHRNAAASTLQIVKETIQSNRYDLIILDEVCWAISKDLIQEHDLIAVLREARPETTLVLTGRNASDNLIEIADTVSVIDCKKHGYREGIKAQKGVEF